MTIKINRWAKYGLAAAGVLACFPSAAEQRVYGYLERVSLPAAGLIMEAKLDTGADNSSIHAPVRERFERDGREWVRFDLQGVDGDPVTVERPIERLAHIKHRTGPNAERPVVYLWLCVGDFADLVEVNLADRSELTVPLLIGRSFLDGGVLVDSAHTHTSEPVCPAPAADE